MAENGIKVLGLNKVVRNLEKLGVDSEDIKDAFTKVGSRVVSQAKLAAPADTGAMKKSIRASRRKNSSYIRMGSAKAYYARFIEYGTLYITPRRVLRGVVQREGAWAVETIESEFNKLIIKRGFDG